MALFSRLCGVVGDVRVGEGALWGLEDGADRYGSLMVDIHRGAGEGVCIVAGDGTGVGDEDTINP